MLTLWSTAFLPLLLTWTVAWALLKHQPVVKKWRKWLIISTTRTGSVMLPAWVSCACCVHPQSGLQCMKHRQAGLSTLWPLCDLFRHPSRPRSCPQSCFSVSTLKRKTLRQTSTVWPTASSTPSETTACWSLSLSKSIKLNCVHCIASKLRHEAVLLARYPNDLQNMIWCSLYHDHVISFYCFFHL